MITTYLFDLDDTLIDTKIYFEIYDELISEIKKKLKINDKELEEKARKLKIKKNKHGKWDTGDLCMEFGMLDVYYSVLEKAINVKKVLHDSVLGIFEALKNKKIGIVSGSMRKTIKLYLERYELSKYVDFIFSTEETKYKKDDISFWKELIKKYNLNPKECLVIGDTEEEDIIPPNKLGFNTLHIKNSKDLKFVLEK